MRVPAIASLFLASTLTAAAVAMPGGGGGGTTTAPSISAPDFDAAKAYREAVEQLKAGKNAEAKASLAKLIKAIPRGREHPVPGGDGRCRPQRPQGGAGPL